MKTIFKILIKRIKRNYREYFLSKCPECKEGRLKSEFLTVHETVVYKCDKCNKRWI